MFTPPKKRRLQMGASINEIENKAFARVAKIPFDARTILPEKLGEYFKLAARSNNTSPEMLLTAALSTTAACLGPTVGLQLTRFGNHRIPPNLYLIGVGKPSCGKSNAYKLAMGKPLAYIANKRGINLQLGEFTKAALLKTLSNLGGRGMISADEISNSLITLLKRSQTDTSGERQILLTMWSGGSHIASYASKADIEISQSGLSLDGFMQPDRYNTIMEEITAIQDGLMERVLFWHLPGRLATENRREAASRKFKTKYTLQSLEPVFLELFDLHNEADAENGKFKETEITYTLTPEAQEYIKSIKDRIHCGLISSDSSTIIDDRYSDSESETEEEEATVVEPLVTSLGQKYTDQLGRLSLSLHCFTQVLMMMLSFGGTVAVERAVPLQAVKNAQRLLDHILKQAITFQESIQQLQEAEDAPERSIEAGIIKKLLEEPGSIVRMCYIYQSRIRNKVIPSSVSAEACVKAQEYGFGTIGTVNNPPSKRTIKVFFKAPAGNISVENLAKFGVSMDMYKQQINLPLPSVSGLLECVHEQHPLKEQFRTSSEQTASPGSVDLHSSVNI